MLPPLINRSPDLKRLVDEGYELALSKSSNILLVTSVPYVNSKKEVKFGTLLTKLELTNDVTKKPNDHVAYFIGEHPCNLAGSEISAIKHPGGRADLDTGLTSNHTFSNKPPTGYNDYHHKITTYVRIISGPAQAIDPNLDARTGIVIEAEEDESPLVYVDTSSGRAQINTINAKLENQRIAIIGLGGTGSYVLDFVAKTRVREIHLFDGDTFLQHNLFRFPGAPTRDDLDAKMPKVAYLKKAYEKVHRHIVAHDTFVDETNVAELAEMTFVFVCIDTNKSKQPIVEALENFGIPFADAGMGLNIAEGALTGLLRLTTSTPQKRDHVREKHRITFVDAAVDNAYVHNIQISELNALNAAIAVIKWKKLVGFYADLDKEHFTVYALNGNQLINEDHHHET